jgi:hypothetical protein
LVVANPIPLLNECPLQCSLSLQNTQSHLDAPVTITTGAGVDSTIIYYVTACHTLPANVAFTVLSSPFDSTRILCKQECSPIIAQYYHITTVGEQYFPDNGIAFFIQLGPSDGLTSTLLEDDRP